MVNNVIVRYWSFATVRIHIKTDTIDRYFAGAGFEGVAAAKCFDLLLQSTVGGVFVVSLSSFIPFR